jgi:hypothetical protein
MDSILAGGGGYIVPSNAWRPGWAYPEEMDDEVMLRDAKGVLASSPTEVPSLSSLAL